MVMVLIITGLILTLLETKSSRCGAEEYFRKILLKNIPDKYSRKIFQSNILGARAEGGGGEAAIKASKSSPWRFAGLYSPAIAP